MTEAILIVLALLLASAPTLRSGRRLPGGECAERASPGVLIKGALAALALVCVVWVSWNVITEMNIGAFVVWQPSLWLVGTGLALTWWRAWRFEGHSPRGARGSVHVAFAGAQVALALSVLGLFAIINLPANLFPELERKGLGWALVSLIPTALAWIVAFQIPRFSRREPRGSWPVFFTLVSVSALLALTMALPGMVIGAGFRGGQIALLGLPWTFLCVMIVPAVGVIVMLANPAPSNHPGKAERAS